LEFVCIDLFNRVSDELHQALVVFKDLNSIIHLNDQEYYLKEGQSDLNRHLLAQEHLSLEPEPKNRIELVIQLSLFSCLFDDLIVELGLCILIFLLGSHQSVGIEVIIQELLN
jgi:hypothetical protein